MSRVPMGSDGGAMASDPQVAYKTYFAPQGIGADLIATKYGISRQDVRQATPPRARSAPARPGPPGGSGIRCCRFVTHWAQTLLDHDEHVRPGTTAEVLAELKPAFSMMGEQYGFDAVALQRYPEVERINHVHTGGQFLRHRGRCRGGAGRHPGDGQGHWA